MEVKPGYKQSELGMIPNDWEVKSVGELGQIKTGPFGTLLKADEYSGNEGVPLISVGEVGAGHFKITEHTPLVPAAVIRRLPQYVLHSGDIVFGRKGAVERSSLVTENEDGWFLGSDGISIRPQRLCHPPYLACQFQRYEVQAWLLQNAIGTTMPSLNQEILGRVQIPYAPLPEQRAIAAALSDVDALIGGLDQLIAKKLDLKQAVMQQLISGQTRLPDFSEKWPTLKLGSLVCDQNAGIFKKAELYGEGCNIVGVADIYDIHYVGGQTFGLVPLSKSERDEYTLKENDLIYSESSLVREGIARTVYVTKEGSGTAFAWHTRRFRVDEKRLLSSFLYYYLQSSPARTHMIQNSIQTAITGINTTSYFACPVPIPSLAEQTAIAEVLTDMDTELAALEKRRDKTRALKQGMMQELLTGRTRLV